MKSFAGHFSRNGGWILLVAILLQLPGQARALQDLGTTGDVWEIAEPDPLAELERIALEKREIIQSMLKGEADLEAFIPAEGLVTVPPAREPKSYIVDTTYTLTHDIRDHDNVLIYPAGFRFDILDCEPFPLDHTYVILNGASDAEIAFVNQRFGDDSTVRLLVTGDAASWRKSLRDTGGIHDLKRLTNEIATVFHIEATVSVVYQEGDHLRVDAIPAPAIERRDGDQSLSGSDSVAPTAGADQ